MVQANLSKGWEDKVQETPDCLQGNGLWPGMPLAARAVLDLEPTALTPGLHPLQQLHARASAKHGLHGFAYHCLSSHSSCFSDHFLSSGRLIPSPGHPSHLSLPPPCLSEALWFTCLFSGFSSEMWAPGEQELGWDAHSCPLGPRRAPTLIIQMPSK